MLQNHLRAGVAKQLIATVSAEGAKATISDGSGLLRFILNNFKFGAFGYPTKC
jgi:hypothetical protein